MAIEDDTDPLRYRRGEGRTAARRFCDNGAIHLAD
jgi:hypothetical protein